MELCFMNYFMTMNSLNVPCNHSNQLSEYNILIVLICRYVEELMRMMVCGEIVDFIEKDGTNYYFIPPWKQQTLKGSIMGCFFAPLLAAPYSKLVECFLKDGPNGTIA
jgi:hypothetical protein